MFVLVLLLVSSLGFAPVVSALEHMGPVARGQKINEARDYLSPIFNEVTLAALARFDELAKGGAVSEDQVGCEDHVCRQELLHNQHGISHHFHSLQQKFIWQSWKRNCCRNILVWNSSRREK